MLYNIVFHAIKILQWNSFSLLKYYHKQEGIMGF
jgi:hypothetical protein